VLVLDLADAGSLADLLAARGRLTPGEVSAAVAPIAAAIGYLHDEGVVHGDVSAANVLFTAAGTPLLADVGVAQLTGVDADAEATPAYVDPLVAAGGAPGAASDVFMLGAVALHALVGSPPWPGDDPTSVLARAASGVLDDVPGRLVAAGVPPDMASVVMRALTVAADRRGTAAGFALDLGHSARPVAIELAAGLARRTMVAPVPPGPRHAAAPARRGVRPADAEAAGRPAFERPREIAAEPGGPPPTRLVAPRPRPVIPRPARRRHVPRPVLAVLAGLLGVAVMAWVGVGWARAGNASPGRPPAVRTSVPRPQVETFGVVPDASEDVDWRAALAWLDATRARAFATRNPDLLSEVYVGGPLLARDVALLGRLVPAGCVLTGARTIYTGVRAAPSGEHAVLSATATVQPSRLVCDGRPRESVPAGEPTPLRVVLVRTPRGVRIQSIGTAAS
jgi:hypothetical protein